MIFNLYISFVSSKRLQSQIEPLVFMSTCIISGTEATDGASYEDHIFMQ